MTHLTDKCKTEVEVLDHPTLNFVQGVVFDYDTVNLAESDLLEELKSEGVTTVRRITKKLADGKSTNTPLIILTFRGTERPEHIRFGMLRVNVRPYYPSVLICRNCAAYGHSSKRCTSSAVCMNCSQKHQIVEHQTCPNPSFCNHCSGAHSPVSKVCPVFRKEEAVIRLRIDRGLSYNEAKSEVEKTTAKPSYASKLQQRLDQSLDKDREIQLLRDELKKIREQMSDYLSVKKELESLKKRHESIPLTQESLSGGSSVINLDHFVTPKPRLSRVDSGKNQSRRTSDQGSSSHQSSPKQTRTGIHRSISRKRTMYVSPTSQANVKRQSQTNRVLRESNTDPEDDDFDIS
ncbi:uncharacterized protein LOC129737729 [Uranotaenia lowii]|uniref:uncharacterized protein LOC129737729 n=1 Tax=Uranotaenia lowii TaxID=190385 RepID=UPI0024785019|nr:uncharacterized protein LOC129737729 [Uranotaenia lowii]